MHEVDQESRRRCDLSLSDERVWLQNWAHVYGCRKRAAVVMKITELLTELRGLPIDDLKSRANDLDDRVFRLRIQKSMGHAQAGNKMRPLRRELARVKTVLVEKGVKD